MSQQKVVQAAMLGGRRIDLTRLEEDLFALLRSTNSHYQLNTVMRVAGGWVRDKLLGRPSDDIDIALDNMDGEKFANYVKEYLEVQASEASAAGADAVSPTVCSSIAVIQSNPEQSKHLMTATMRIMGLSIDFVNLRSEAYTEASRIPQITCGTPEQDAQRRDLTINSMFWNINESTVEDFTGGGLVDLDAGLVRTPLPAVQTFTDDPLRLMRAVRFASRFSFQIVQDIFAASQDPAVRSALDTKISRERIGHELDGILRGPDPVRGLQILADMSLLGLVFKCPGADLFAQGSAFLQFATPPGAAASGEQPVNVAQVNLDAICKLQAQSPFFRGMDVETRRAFLLAGVVHPAFGLSYTNEKKKKVDIVSYVISHGLKLPTRDAVLCGNVLAAAVLCNSLMQSAQFSFVSGEAVAQQQFQAATAAAGEGALSAVLPLAGLYIPQSDTASTSSGAAAVAGYTHCVVTGISRAEASWAVYQSYDQGQGKEALARDNWAAVMQTAYMMSKWARDPSALFLQETPPVGNDLTILHYELVSQALQAHGVLGMGVVKALVRGPDVMSALQCKPGPHLTGFLQSTFRWQLASTNTHLGTSPSKDDCVEWLKQQHQQPIA